MEPDAKLAAELMGLGSRDEYLRAASELLLALFPGETVAWNDLDEQSSRAEVRTYPEQPRDYSRILLEFWADHPLIVSYVTDHGDGVWDPRRLSDFVTDRQLYRTRAYTEALGPAGSNRQLTFLVKRPSGVAVRGWSMNRAGVDFTDREMELTRHIQPVLRLLDTAFPENTSSEHWADSERRQALTGRELEILQLMSNGLTAVAVGHLLGISPRTVAKHLEHAYAKLGCTNRIDALRVLRGTAESAVWNRGGA